MPGKISHVDLISLVYGRSHSWKVMVIKKLTPKSTLLNKCDPVMDTGSHRCYYHTKTMTEPCHRISNYEALRTKNLLFILHSSLWRNKGVLTVTLSLCHSKVFENIYPPKECKALAPPKPAARPASHFTAPNRSLIVPSPTPAESTHHKHASTAILVSLFLQQTEKTCHPPSGMFLYHSREQLDEKGATWI